MELHDRDRRSDVIKPLPKIFDIHGDEGALFDTSGSWFVFGYTSRCLLFTAEHFNFKLFLLYLFI